MSVKLKLWIVALAVLGILAARILGDSAAIWKDGGEQGVVNLPLCASASPIPASTSAYDYGYKMKSVSDGAKMILPSNLQKCVVTLTYSGVAVSSQAASGTVRIIGQDLAFLRDCGVLRFEMAMVDGNKRLDVLFVLHAGDDPFEIYVKCR